VLDFCSGGDLCDCLNRNELRSLSQQREAFRMMSSAVIFLHRHNVAHRDIVTILAFLMCLIVFSETVELSCGSQQRRAAHSAVRLCHRRVLQSHPSGEQKHKTKQKRLLNKRSCTASFSRLCTALPSCSTRQKARNLLLVV
jgi:hypothetical protein